MHTCKEIYHRLECHGSTEWERNKFLLGELNRIWHISLGQGILSRTVKIKVQNGKLSDLARMHDVKGE